MSGPSRREPLDATSRSQNQTVLDLDPILPPQEVNQRGTGRQEASRKSLISQGFPPVSADFPGISSSPALRSGGGSAGSNPAGGTTPQVPFSGASSPFAGGRQIDHLGVRQHPGNRI